MKFALLLLVALAGAAFSQGVFLVPDGQDANGNVSAEAPAMAYDGIGNLWVKIGVGASGWGKIISTSTVTNPPPPPAPPSNLSAFTAPDLLLLRNRTWLDMDRILVGKTDTNTQWQWFDGATVNTNCWVWPLDFSGISMIEGSGQTITLVTRRHGITCAHSIPSIGSETIFVGNDLIRYTNWVQLLTNCPFTSDLTVVQFSNDFPQVVRPFPLLPTDYAAWGDLGRSAGPLAAEAVWYRPNTGRMNVRMIWSWLTELGASGLPSLFTWAAFPWVSPIFTEPATAGDSGSPAFLIINGAPVFLFAAQSDDPLGPLVSFGGRSEWIQAVCGTNYPLSFVSLSRYPQMP